MSRKPSDLGSLKEGSFIIINEEPCKIVSMEKSKPGKHGSMKARVVAIGVFDGSRRTITAPVDQMVEVPVISKRSAQVLAITGSTIQLMDLENYEVYETYKKQIEPELTSRITVGSEVEVWEILGRRKIIRIK